MVVEKVEEEEDVEEEVVQSRMSEKRKKIRMCAWFLERNPLAAQLLMRGPSRIRRRDGSISVPMEPLATRWGEGDSEDEGAEGEG